MQQRCQMQLIGIQTSKSEKAAIVLQHLSEFISL